jgi:hypothetical protein
MSGGFVLHTGMSRPWLRFTHCECAAVASFCAENHRSSGGFVLHFQLRLRLRSKALHLIVQTMSIWQVASFCIFASAGSSFVCSLRLFRPFVSLSFCWILQLHVGFVLQNSAQHPGRRRTSGPGVGMASFCTSIIDVIASHVFAVIFKPRVARTRPTSP